MAILIPYALRGHHLHDGFIDRYQRDELIEKLPRDCDADPVSPGDISWLFEEPMLFADGLAKLDFTQLCSLYRRNGTLFTSLVNDPMLLHSKQQCYWRLFFRLIAADEKRQLKILSHAPYIEFFVEEPRLLELTIQELPQPLLGKHIEKALAELLGNCLDNKIKVELNDKQLRAIVYAIRTGDLLLQAIEKQIKTTFDLQALHSDPLGDQLLELRYWGGDRNISASCRYDLMKAAARNNMEDEREHLLAHLDIANLLEEYDHKALLDEINSLQLEKLKNKIDSHIALHWMKGIKFKAFVELLPFFKEQNLFISLQKAKLLLTDHLQRGDPCWTGKETAEDAREILLTHLEAIEHLYPYDQQHQLLKMVRDSLELWLSQHPNIIVELWKWADKQNNVWLTKSVLAIYYRHRDLFDIYWHMPPIELQLAEVIVEKYSSSSSES